MRKGKGNNTRIRKYNYRTSDTWGKKSVKMASELKKYMEIALTQPHINKLVDYNLLSSAADHLNSIDQLLNQKP